MKPEGVVAFIALEVCIRLLCFGLYEPVGGNVYVFKELSHVGIWLLVCGVWYLCICVSSW